VLPVTKVDNGRLEVKGDFSLGELNQKNQALQWFDLQGNIVAMQTNVISFPFSTNKISQIETDERRVKAITWPVMV